jgi:hypothetical protein
MNDLVRRVDPKLNSGRNSRAQYNQWISYLQPKYRVQEQLIMQIFRYFSKTYRYVGDCF